MKTLRYNQPGYSTRSFLKSPALKEAALNEICKDLRRECSLLCSRSLFTKTNIKNITSFDLKKVITLVEKKAPTFFRFMCATSRSPGSKRPLNYSAVCMAIAIILKQRYTRASLFQKIVSSILYAGHAAKRVYVRLSHLGLCTSATTMSRMVKQMGCGHDADVLRWKRAWEGVPKEDGTGTLPIVYNSSSESQVSSPISTEDTCTSITSESEPFSEPQTNEVDTALQSTSAMSLHAKPTYIIVSDNLDKN